MKCFYMMFKISAHISQKINHASIIEINHVIFFMKIITIHSDSYKKRINEMCVKMHGILKVAAANT